MITDNLTSSQQKKFNTKSGMNTSVWGPKLWDSLFIMILGAYPPKLKNNSEHKKIKKAFTSTLCNLQYTLPCSFCRVSYKQYYNELPIEQFTGSRLDMLYWLYLIKDKVNKKLLSQEIDYLTELHKKYKANKISKPQYLKTVKNCFMTVSSPRFVNVLEKYEKHRAVCNKKLKKCTNKK